MVVGCTGNYRKEEYYSILRKVHKQLDSNEFDILVSTDLLKTTEFEKPKSYQYLEFEELAENSDILFAIGGDGTILSTVRRLGSKMKPIMGIHIGGLGFLSESTEEYLEQSIDYIKTGNYSISKRMLLNASVELEKGEIQTYSALNDIVVDHGPSARLLKSEIHVSGQYLNTYESDGIIFSTPTGSTAYSLSAGGPIIYPAVNTITVTPICPHSLSARAIVLQDNEEITIRFPYKYEKIGLAIDGQIHFHINDKAKILIKKADFTAELIGLPSNGYFKTLRTKMGWSGNVR